MAAIYCTLLVNDETTNYVNQDLLRRMAITGAVPVASPSCLALILLDMKMPRIYSVAYAIYARHLHYTV